MLEWLTSAGMSVFWLVLMVVFLVVEAATVGLVSIWFAAGALGGLLTSFFTPNIWIQVAVCLVVSLLCMVAMRPLARKYIHPKQVPTNADQVIGAEGLVTEDIDNLNAHGQVTVRGAVWTARAEGEEGLIPAGSRVRILRIEGVKVIVSPV